ncbi:MAG: ribose transport system ATP-binding protein [Pseudonocardiales bacterium]|nr:ribose transport system ATP-binding protein [Pseudonocardiales bacterium]MDT7681004.1 ribose transport system ATP-binding protein [Pseudonocardiales bacterium]
MADPLFVAENLVKTFPGVRALDRATLRLHAGTVHALLGENGAGKSTLIKILTGVHRADSGRMVLDGREIAPSSPRDAARAGIGVVHQERNLVPGFSIGENIVLQGIPARRGLVDRAAIRAEARRCLDQLDLDLDPDTPTAGLSVAQLQLVEVAKALHTNSQVLLLDEPTTASTPSEVERLFTVVRRLRDAGTAVVFVSHKLEEVFELCDTVTVLRDGASVLEAAPLAGTNREELVDRMVGRSHLAEPLPARPAPAAEPVLELVGVATDAGHRDVSLSVRPGEIVGLYGLVGAGRSELAKALLGLSKVTAGEVRVRGRAVRIRDVRDALRTHRIGYVPEDRKAEGLFLDQPVTRNIAVTVWDRIASRFTGVSQRREEELAAGYVEQLGIRLASSEQLVGELSGGNQQKVSLAKWLAARTEILIIDEPTVGIDVRTKAAFHELIGELAVAGLAVLLITSDLPEMVALADRVVVMRAFRVQGEVANDAHEYDPTSRAVMSLIHA